MLYPALYSRVIKEATRFEVSSKKIVDDFTALKIDFGFFTGSFGSWASEKGQALDKQITQLTDEVQSLDREIEDIQKKMLWTGVIGTPVLVGLTVGIVAVLGPIGLV